MRNSPFFDGIEQAELEFDGQRAPMPIFYYEGNAMLAMFPARYGALKKLLPDPRFIPSRLAPGIGLIGVAAFEYIDCDIGPYNELAVTIMLEDSRSSASIPGRALVKGLRQNQFSAYVQRLPVTTEIALRSGNDLYGYPKIVADIDFAEDAATRSATLRDKGEEVLSLDIKKISAERSEHLRVLSHLYQNRLPQSAEFEVNALRVGQSFKYGGATLNLEPNHEIARELDGVLLSRRSVHLMYMPHFEAILHGPDRIYIALQERIEGSRADATLV